MTSYTRGEFRDALLELIHDSIKADSYTDDFEIFFDDDVNNSSSGDNEPDPETSWFEILIKHNIGGQSTLQGTAGNKRFQRDGVVTVNIYTPFGDNMNANDTISEIVSKIFENYSGPIWFRNTIASEFGNYRSWYLTVVTSEFQYDQIR